jgi:hypothetical protein
MGTVLYGVWQYLLKNIDNPPQATTAAVPLPLGSVYSCCTAVQLTRPHRPVRGDGESGTLLVL